MLIPKSKLKHDLGVRQLSEGRKEYDTVLECINNAKTAITV